MRKVGLGFIGCGICARDLHWPALKELQEQFEVINVCSRSEGKAQKFAELTGSKRFCTDVDELLWDTEVEAVVIVYPFEQNYVLTKKALQAGKHVFVEKPMARTLDEAYEMVEMEKETELVTMIAEGFHYRPSVLKVKEMVEAGKIGKPTAMMVRLLDHFKRDAKWLTESDWRLGCVGGVMLDRDVHWFAAIREIYGEVKNAIGYQKLLRDDIGPVDQVSLYMEFENGATGTFIDIASIESVKENTFLMVGTEGTIRMDRFSKIELDNIRGEKEVIEFENGDGGGYVEEFIDFYECIVNGGTPRSSFYEGYKDLQLGMVSLESNEKWDKLSL